METYYPPDGSPVGNKLARFVPENELCEACKLIRHLKNEELNRSLNSDERKSIRKAAEQWASTHLESSVNENGQQQKRLIIKHKRLQNGIILKREFFSETFAKNNKKWNRHLALTMEMATKISEWLPKAVYVRTEAGKHHSFPFDVFEITIDGLTIESKIAMKHSGAYAYMMRIK